MTDISQHYHGPAHYPFLYPAPPARLVSLVNATRSALRRGRAGSPLSQGRVVSPFGWGRSGSFRSRGSNRITPQQREGWVTPQLGVGRVTSQPSTRVIFEYHRTFQVSPSPCNCLGKPQPNLVVMMKSPATANAVGLYIT